MKPITFLTVTLSALISVAIQTRAQIAVPPPAPVVQLRSAAELDQMLGTIALYPDPLIAQILPAATLPTQVVLAYRYVSSGSDINLIDQQSWDASVKALARYPDILKMMNDNLAWTTDLGQSFLYQQQDVMDSIQRLRAEALNLGNLQSNPQQMVDADGGIIEIVPANPEIIYVPVYQPELVFFQRPFGRFFISFGVGLRIGGWLDHDCDWRGHNIIVWDHAHPRPSDWWHERPSQRPRTIINNVPVWRSPGRPVMATDNHRDRGWNPRDSHPVYTAPPRPVQVHNDREPTPNVARPVEVHVNPPRVEHAPIERPEGSAFTGVGNAHETHAASSRGQQSVQAISRPEPSASHNMPAGSPPPKNR